MERVVSLPEAAERATSALAELGMRPELTDLGHGRNPTAWSCRMLTGDGVMPAMAEGMGKGWREDARVGALFEALEHYLTGPDLFDPGVARLARSAHLAAGPLNNDVCSLLLARTPASRLACHRYRPLGGGEEILVPLFLSAPWYAETHNDRLRERTADTCDYGELMRYSCNSGSAIGVTGVEALLHAVNETIERDALSLLLLRAFLGTTGYRPTVIDPATLPAESASAHSAAERLTGSPVFLLDITSDIPVPTMLAYTAPTGLHPHRHGAGTSLSPAHAAWRALTELLQITLAESLWQPDHAPRGDLAELDAYPELSACGRFDLSDHLRGARTVPFNPGGRVPAPAAQLHRLVAILTTCGHPPYHRTVATLRGGITAVHVIALGLERFVLISAGNLVIPGPRGQAAARGE